MGLGNLTRTRLLAAALGASLAAFPLQMAFDSTGGLRLAWAQALADGADDHGFDDQYNWRRGGHGNKGGGNPHTDPGAESAPVSDPAPVDSDLGPVAGDGSKLTEPANTGTGHGTTGSPGTGRGFAFTLQDGTQVRITAGGRDILLIYANGRSEEISNGRYELRDARKQREVERAATGEDYVRLQGLLSV